MKQTRSEVMGTDQKDSANNLDMHSLRSPIKHPSVLEDMLNTHMRSRSSHNSLKRVSHTARIHQQNTDALNVALAQTPTVANPTASTPEEIANNRLPQGYLPTEYEVSYTLQLVPETRIECIPVIVNTSRLEYIPHYKEITRNKHPKEIMPSPFTTLISQNRTRSPNTSISSCKECGNRSNSQQPTNLREEVESMTFGSGFNHSMTTSIVDRVRPHASVLRNRKYKIFEIPERIYSPKNKDVDLVLSK